MAGLKDEMVTIELPKDVALVLDALFDRLEDSEDLLTLNMEEMGEWGAFIELADKIKDALTNDLAFPGYIDKVEAGRERMLKKHGGPAREIE